MLLSTFGDISYLSYHIISQELGLAVGAGAVTEVVPGRIPSAYNRRPSAAPHPLWYRGGVMPAAGCQPLDETANSKVGKSLL